MPYICDILIVHKKLSERKNGRMAEKTAKKIITLNRKARHDFFVEDTYEAGIALFGTEVKSLRQGTVNLKDSYCYIKNGEIFSTGIHISPYEKGNIFNKDPLRERKLLMHKKEILKLHALVGQQGYTLVPLSLYFSGKNVKLELGVCKGKKLYDKREDAAKKAEARDIDRYERERAKY